MSTISIESLSAAGTLSSRAGTIRSVVSRTSRAPESAETLTEKKALTTSKSVSANEKEFRVSLFQVILDALTRIEVQENIASIVQP